MYIFVCVGGGGVQKNRLVVTVRQMYAAWSNALVKDTDFHTFAII